MCLLCASNGPDSDDAARRRYILGLLALLERPDVLPGEVALRLGREIMATVDRSATRLRCDPLESDAAAGESR